MEIKRESTAQDRMGSNAKMIARESKENAGACDPIGLGSKEPNSIGVQDASNQASAGNKRAPMASSRVAPETYESKAEKFFRAATRRPICSISQLTQMAKVS